VKPIDAVKACKRKATRQRDNWKARALALLNASEQAIVDLSVHPAGCVDYAWYENQCLEVAERLEDAVHTFKKGGEG
jgi:hypothetical protein